MSWLFGPGWHWLLVCSQHNGVFLGWRSEAREGDGDREDSHVSPGETAQHRGVVLPGCAAEPILGGATLPCWLSPKDAGRGVRRAAQPSMARDATGGGTSTSIGVRRVSVSSTPLAFFWKLKKNKPKFSGGALLLKWKIWAFFVPLLS